MKRGSRRGRRQNGSTPTTTTAATRTLPTPKQAIRSGKCRLILCPSSGSRTGRARRTPPPTTKTATPPAPALAQAALARRRLFPAAARAAALGLRRVQPPPAAAAMGTAVSPMQGGGRGLAPALPPARVPGVGLAACRHPQSPGRPRPPPLPPPQRLPQGHPPPPRRHRVHRPTNGHHRLLLPPPLRQRQRQHLHPHPHPHLQRMVHPLLRVAAQVLAAMQLQLQLLLLPVHENQHRTRLSRRQMHAWNGCSATFAGRLNRRPRQPKRHLVRRRSGSRQTQRGRRHRPRHRHAHPAECRRRPHPEANQQQAAVHTAHPNWGALGRLRLQRALTTTSNRSPEGGHRQE